jgi:hypothetical protein
MIAEAATAKTPASAESFAANATRRPPNADRKLYPILPHRLVISFLSAFAQRQIRRESTANERGAGIERDLSRPAGPAG